MTFELVESPMGSKDTILGKFWIARPLEGPRLLFQYLFLTIIDNIYKTVSRILLLRKFSNPDYRISFNKCRGSLLNLRTVMWAVLIRGRGLFQS